MIQTCINLFCDSNSQLVYMKNEKPTKYMNIKRYKCNKCGKESREFTFRCSTPDLNNTK